MESAGARRAVCHREKAEGVEWAALDPLRHRARTPERGGTAQQERENALTSSRRLP